MALQLSWCLLFVLLTQLCAYLAALPNGTFLFNGFDVSDLSLSGFATITSSGAILLADPTTSGIKGQAFYPNILQFKKVPLATTTQSFSTRFVFEIVPEIRGFSGRGFTFVLAPSTDFSRADGESYLGLFNPLNNGNQSNHIFAVEFDTSQQVDLKDINANHVGIDVNDVISNFSQPGVVLDSQTPIQAWIEYDGKGKQLNVTIAPLSHPLKPNHPLISRSIDLSPVLLEHMYVGFSAGTENLVSKHYILAWSFTMDGKAPELDISRLPSTIRGWRRRTNLLGRRGLQEPSYQSQQTTDSKSSKLSIYIPVALVALLLLIVTVGIPYSIYKKLTYDNIEEWEIDCPHRLPYREIYSATKGFKEELGKGGFGSVYKGVLLRSGMEVAVKKISHSSKQGIREFVAEVSSLGRMRHRNLVQLHGWCRRGEDMLLVYEFMPNGSLDSFLFDVKGRCLSWEQRFKIVKGIASGLLYLHEEWEQVVVHRDVKASNVLLDGDLNARLGDFGLARFYEHGSNPQTTRLVGTFGYIAPELCRTWKATASSDVYAYGVLLLEVACGRRPLEPERPSEEEIFLVELVQSLWKDGRILDAMDKRLGNSYVVEEAELVLKLGMLCSQNAPESRPNMRQLTQFLNGDASLQDLECHNLLVQDDPGTDQLMLQYLSSEKLSTTSGGSGSITY